MPTITLDPDGQGFFNNWTLGAGASKTVAVSDGDDGTYIFPDPSPSDLESYTLTALGVSSPKVVTVTPVLRINGTLDSITAFAYALVRFGGNNELSAALPLNAATGIVTVQASLPRPGGGAWQPA